MLKNYQFTIGQLTYTIRKLNKLTQVEFSQRLGVVQSTISKIEKDIFDDVPFSVVNKISLEFNIPLNYFQIGLLPTRKNSSIYRVIPKNYVSDGVFKAKTIFYVLKELKKDYSSKLYKDIKLPEQYLSLCNISYSFEFINKLYSLTQNSLLTAIDAIESNIHATEKIELDNIYQYLLGTHGITIIEDKITTSKTNPIFQLKFSSELHELDLVYSKLLKLELTILFNAKFEVKKAVDSDIFEVYTKELVS